MKLLRVQVPDFRVLKNVDISFEKDFVPNIFPLGSQNGGGKSTLLQLIFILLHCSGDSERHEFIKNMLHGFDIDDNSQKRVLAIIDIWDGEKVVNLEFYLSNDFAFELSELFKEEPDFSDASLINNLSEYMILSAPSRLKDINEKIEIIKNKFPKNRFQRELDLNKLREERKKLEYILPKIFNCLHSNQITYICNYSNSKNEDKFLLCHVNNLEIDQTENFLKNLSRKMFLAAPTTQVFLFLSQDKIKLLFQQGNDYQSQIQNAKSKLTGLFPYDFFAVNLLIEVFKNARDKDFKEAIETGEYGDSYKQLIKDLNLLLLNKKINITPDLSGFTFKLHTDNRDTELSPADLSHGELKRLSIYAWLKYNVIDDAIVLMDELENGFHPDWQYQIIKDISEWSPNNQYIIATHSYELCQAVTPAHVKELEPRLIKQESES